MFVEEGLLGIRQGGLADVEHAPVLPWQRGCGQAVGGGQAAQAEGSLEGGEAFFGLKQGHVKGPGLRGPQAPAGFEHVVAAEFPGLVALVFVA